MTEQEFIDSYEKIVHAIQSGVKHDHETGGRDGTPKHLRVGINSVKCDHAALVMLLVKKGLITKEEYFDESIKMLQKETENYEKLLSQRLGVKITLK
jgi:hypothetical protein